MCVRGVSVEDSVDERCEGRRALWVRGVRVGDSLGERRQYGNPNCALPSHGCAYVVGEQIGIFFLFL